MTADKTARWYSVSREGFATKCRDEQDAQAVARESDANWPREAPHSAVNLVDIAAVADEREACARLFDATLNGEFEEWEREAAAKIRGRA